MIRPQLSRLQFSLTLHEKNGFTQLYNWSMSVANVGRKVAFDTNSTQVNKFASQFVCKCGLNLMFSWNFRQFCNIGKSTNAMHICARFVSHTKVEYFTVQ